MTWPMFKKALPSGSIMLLLCSRGRLSRKSCESTVEALEGAWESRLIASIGRLGRSQRHMTTKGRITKELVVVQI